MATFNINQRIMTSLSLTPKMFKKCIENRPPLIYRGRKVSCRKETKLRIGQCRSRSDCTERAV